MRKVIILLSLFGLVSCGKSNDSEVTKKEDNQKKEVPGYNSKVIYGEDNRLDYYQVSSEMKSLADSTVALVRNSRLSETSDGYVQIDSESYGSSMGLCSSEPFYAQETAAFCSGSLVGEDLILTAGHCIKSQADCRGTSFVFGFRMDSEVDLRTKVSVDDVYGCEEVIHTQVGRDDVDYAVIRLKRAVVGRRPLAIKRDQGVVEQDSIFVIGHPSGLPTKVAGGAKVRSVVEDRYFVANLDTYGGNSGSAVFDQAEGKIVGVLVRGEQDFVYKNSCMVSNVCQDDSCRGEDVTIIKNALAYIPELEEPEPPVQEPPSEVFINDIEIDVPDANSKGVESSIEISVDFKISEVKVAVEIEHSWIGDLNVRLISPSGEEVILHARSGGSKNDIRGVYGESLNSANSLDKFIGSSAKGVWKLIVSDHAKRDVGSLISWGIQFK